MKMHSFLFILFLLVNPWIHAEDFRALAKKAIPAVVALQVKIASPTMNLDPLGDDLFRQFFGFLKQPLEPQMASGSGFLISDDGYIVTNNHVVKQKGEILVKLQDGREFPAKVIGEDASTDLAVIKIDVQDLFFLHFADPNALEVGQYVVAIGNTFGLQATLTVGVVSAKGRTHLAIARIEDFIQTNAAINRGDSGGPLLDLQGNVTGVNTAIAVQGGTQGYAGIGFAIPSGIAEYVTSQLISNGTITPGFLGISLQSLDQDLAQALDLNTVEEP